MDDFLHLKLHETLEFSCPKAEIKYLDFLALKFKYLMTLEPAKNT